MGFVWSGPEDRLSWPRVRDALDRVHDAVLKQVSGGGGRPPAASPSPDARRQQ